MLINKLRDYYGFPGAEEQSYITRETAGMSEERQDEIADRIIQICLKKSGFPDVSKLARFINDAKGEKKVINYYWAVCDDCKAEYDYRFMKCPACHLKGKVNSGYKVRLSTEGIPAKVIRWNQTTLIDDGQGTYCVSCGKREQSYCPHFGNPNHMCTKSDFEYCECKQCCAYHKKQNEKMQKWTNERNSNTRN